ncbi:MAG: PQQ-binding-like beta-propeller repeat protein [Gemmataceae bacterium]
MKLYAWCLALVLHGATAFADDWPQWQGPDRTAVSRETGLLKDWPKGGPSLAWKVTGIGEGMGGIAVSRGRIYTTGDSDGSAWLFALNESDGKQVWKAKIGRAGKYGNVFRPSGPRATPTIDGDKLYILSQHGDLVCFTIDGKEVWRIDYIKDLGGINPVWGFSESILVDGDKLVCTPGTEDGTLMALDKGNGKPLWKCKVPEGPTGDRGFLGTSGAAYSSVIAVEFEGVRQYVQLTATTMVGVSTDGKLLWRYDRASNTHRINCSTPVYADGTVFAASSYDAGGGAVKLSKDDKEGITAKELYFSRTLKNHHGGMVLVDGYLYGSFDPGILTCLEFKTGKVMWQERRPGKGSIVYADGHLYCRNEGAKGTVYLVGADPKKYEDHGQFDQPDRSKEQAWPHPVVANGKLYIRDQDVLLCYDVKAK